MNGEIVASAPLSPRAPSFTTKAQDEFRAAAAGIAFCLLKTSGLEFYAVC